MRPLLVAIALIGAARLASAQECSNCAPYRVLHAPFRVYGNTYFVGTNGLSAMLVTSDRGHVLIDGGLPETAAIVEGNIKSLGFKVEDVKVILNSHTHFDHAGGIAELQRASGARVVASPWSARELSLGSATKEECAGAAGQTTERGAQQAVGLIHR